MTTEKAYQWHRLVTLSILAGVMLIIGSCSTEKDAWLNRGFHDMNAHYNGYFNARELIKESRRSYSEGYLEDYEKILPIYHYASDDDVEGLRSSMQTAVEKTSTVIAKNSMPNPDKSKRRKKEEWCKWIDDNWLVMGKANFYQREFAVADEIFKYIKITYPTQSSIYWADLWLAKSAVERGRFGSAVSIFEQLKETMVEVEKWDPKKKDLISNRHAKYDIQRPVGKIPPPLPKGFEAEYYTAYADLYLKKGENKKAVDMLKDAILKNKKKKVRTRLTFILAQVYEELGDKNNATFYYKEVTKMTAPYEMEFYAKIKRALLYNGGDSRGLKAELLKMLKDEKNKDYLDQIYYALAEISFAKGRRDEGIKNLQNSAKYSTTNTRQKAKTYVRLGDIYYDDKKYPSAKVYYDSCLTVIDDTHENYNQIKERSEGLTELVENLDLYQRQDSLLSWVGKGEDAYMRHIEDLIEDRKRRDEEEFEARQNDPSLGGGTFKTDFGEGAEWIIYNEQAKAFGKKEFKVLWGDRPLEDNWRRSNKNQLNLGGENDAQEDSLSADAMNPYHPDYYLKNLPLEQERQDKAHDDIALALYNLGVIYKTKLDEPELSEKYFLELAKRYGDKEIGLPGLYQLYVGYKSANNKSEADKWKTKILNDFPDSPYAKRILNPNFDKQELAAKERHGKEYGEVFGLYQTGKYDEVVSKCDEVTGRTEPNYYIPKYLLLKAYALGEKNGKDLASIQAPLEVLVKDHAETEEGVRAKSLLEKIKKQNSMDDVQAGNSSFVYNEEMEHFLVVIYPNADGNISPTKSKISDFNSAFFGSRKLKTKSTPLTKKEQMIVVRSFKNKATATQYLKAFKANKTLLKDINSKYEFFIITHKNYAALYIEKDLEAYNAFYKKNY